MALIALSIIQTFACDTLAIDLTHWEILYVSSEEPTGEAANNDRAMHAIDIDVSTFWHLEWKEQEGSYPYTLTLDFKDTLDINGISILTRDGTTNGRISEYELYISNDTNQWGEVQIKDIFTYNKPNSGAQQETARYFGAIRGRFVKLGALSRRHADTYAMLAARTLLDDHTCTETGQRDQRL